MINWGGGFLHQKGYTLIELVVVVAVISIIVVVSPVSRNLYRSLETLISVRNIIMDFRWARMKAIEDNKDLRIRVYKDDNIYKKDKDFQSDYIIYEESSGEIIRSGVFPDYLILYKNLNEVRINKDYYERIKFRYDGTASHGTVGLKLGSRIYKIVVSQLGRVRLAK